MNNVDLDYVSNTIEPSYPEGIDVEVFKYSALKYAFFNATLPSECEHVTPYIYNHPEIFSLRNFAIPNSLAQYRLTVDYFSDIELARAIYNYFGESYFSYLDIIEFLLSNPSLLSMNSNIIRNEGYLKSIKDE